MCVFVGVITLHHSQTGRHKWCVVYDWPNDTRYLILAVLLLLFFLTLPNSTERIDSTPGGHIELDL